MSKVIKYLGKEIVFTIAVILYVWGAIAAPEKALAAAKYTAVSFLNMVPILVAVFSVIGLFNVLVDKKKVAALLGRDAGFKGVAIASALGTFLVGPIYAIFPLIKTVKEHGARWAVIGAVMTTWAIKIPMLPMEASILGWKFSAARVVLVAIAAPAVGYSLEWFMGLAKQGKAQSQPSGEDGASAE